ncbi:unnamed protein product [Calypogeia fissa]
MGCGMWGARGQCMFSYDMCAEAIGLYRDHGYGYGLHSTVMGRPLSSPSGQPKDSGDPGKIMMARSLQGIGFDRGYGDSLRGTEPQSTGTAYGTVMPAEPAIFQFWTCSFSFFVLYFYIWDATVTVGDRNCLAGSFLEGFHLSSMSVLSHWLGMSSSSAN